MPIKFRCPHCRQFLGISPAKAGELTDCPACGRTVRVPNLDGSVAPLPPVRIDLRDTQLADALSALSQIGTRHSPPGTAAAPLPAPATAGTGIAAAPQPIAVAVPVTPPLRPERVASSVAQTVQPPSTAAVPNLLIDFDPMPVAVKPPRRSRGMSFPPELRIAVAALIVVVTFLAGVLAGRAWERRSKGSAAASPNVLPTRDHGPLPAARSQLPSFAQLPPSSAPVQGVSGMLTYVAEDGQSRPDGGGRVIALPEQAPRTPPLVASGFRAGAVQADRERAVSAIQGLGGDFAIADADGHYQLQLPAGRYHILWVSRHQPRDPATPLDAQASGVLGRWFDQPNALVGSVRIDASALDFDGTVGVFNHSFSR